MKPCAEDFSEYIETLRSSPQEERRTKEEKTGNSQSFAGFYSPFLKREKLCVWVSKKAWCFPLFSCILYFGGSFASERRLGCFFPREDNVCKAPFKDFCNRSEVKCSSTVFLYHAVEFCHRFLNAKKKWKGPYYIVFPHLDLYTLADTAKK